MDSNGVKYDPSKLDVLNGIAFNADKNTFYTLPENIGSALFELKLNQ